jgi:hypothetical protein
MAINVEWDNPEKTILCYYFDQRWSWDEFFEARNQALSMIDTVTHKVGVIMNTPPNIVVPSNVLTHSLSSLRHTHPNTVIIVFIAGKPFLNMVISMMTKVSHKTNDYMAMADNMDEARVLIAKRLHAMEESQVRP